MSHYDDAEHQLDYVEPMITGNVEAMLRAANTHAILALVDALESVSALVAIPKMTELH